MQGGLQMKFLKELTLPQCLLIIFILYLIVCTPIASHLFSILFILVDTVYKICGFFLVATFVLCFAYGTYQQWHKKGMKGILILTPIFIFIVVVPAAIMLYGWYQDHIDTFSSFLQQADAPKQKREPITLEELNKAATQLEHENNEYIISDKR